MIARGRALKPVLVAGALLVSRPLVAASPEIAELEYSRSRDLEGCPDEAAFRHAVAERLRRDPFVPGAARKIRVRLTRSHEILTALISVERAGQAPGERRIDTRGGCEELASGAALAVSIAVDPLGALDLSSEGAPADAAPEPAPPPKPAPPLKRAPPAPLPPHRSAVNPRQRSKPRLTVQGGARAWVGIVPELSVGPSLGFGVEHDSWSLALDALFVFPRSQNVAGTPHAISVRYGGAQFSPCWHVARFRSCALLGAGALLARGQGISEPRSGTSWYATLGVGLGYSFVLGDFSLTPLVEISTRLSSSALALDDQVLWTTPRALGSLGFELGYAW